MFFVTPMNRTSFSIVLGIILLFPTVLSAQDQNLEQSEKYTFGNHSGPVDVSISLDGTKALTSSGESKIQIWNTAGGYLDLHVEREFSILSTKLSPDNQKILVGSLDGTVQQAFSFGKTWTAVAPIGRPIGYLTKKKIGGSEG